MVCVCGVPVTWVSPAQTAEPTEMLFGADLQGADEPYITLAPPGEYD